MDVLASIFKPLEEKLRSPLYFGFVLAFIVSNWDVFVTLFFVSNESILGYSWIPKTQFIHDVIIWNKDWMASIFWQGAFWIILGYIFIFVLRYWIPAGITFLAIKYLPYLGNWAHDVEKDFALMRDERNFRYRSDRLKKEEEILWHKKEAEKISLESQKLAIELQEKQKQLDSVSSNNDDEEFIRLATDYPWAQKIIREFIYDQKGLFHNIPSNSSPVKLKEIIPLMEARKIIEVKKGINVRAYDLTDKGLKFITS